MGRVRRAIQGRQGPFRNFAGLREFLQPRVRIEHLPAMAEAVAAELGGPCRNALTT